MGMDPNQVITWLLEPSDLPVRYRTLRDLLDRPAGDPELQAARAGIPDSPAVVGMLAKMHPGGYWLQKNSRGEMVGDGVVYGSYATTHFVLAYLAELGLDRSHPGVAQAAERYLDLQKPDGDWWDHFSCLYGYNIRNFILLGYRDDERVQRAVGLLEAAGRADGGYLCDWHERPSKRVQPKSCIRGSLKALGAFTELGPDYWRGEACVRLVDYFLERGGIFKRRHPDMPVNKDVAALNFPFTWGAGLVEVLYHLSRMGHGADPRLERAWALLESRADAGGRYPLDWTPSQRLWKVGARGQPNKWVTLYALLSKKAAGGESY